jgi:hypothetical protein
MAVVAGLESSIVAQQSNNTAPAAKSAVVAELFTSEGCSSCPPADAILAQMDGKTYAGAPIIVLSEHVDYWNHDGWRDPYSSEQWTQRQNSYNDRFHLENGVYTPQMVIDGNQQMVGSNGGQVTHALETAAAQQGKLEITIINPTWNNDVLMATVSVPALTPQTAKGTDLYAVLDDDEDTSNVLRGENSGHTLKHVSVVRVMQKVSSLHGPYSGGISIKLPHGVARGKMRLIVFAQKGPNGEIFGAAQSEV